MTGRSRDNDSTEEIPTEEEAPTEEIPTEEIPTEEVPTKEAPTVETSTTEENLAPPTVATILQVDWQYMYDGRELCIVRTGNGNEAWYIRTGKGGEAKLGEPGAGDPAPMRGCGIWEPVNEVEAAKLGERPKKWKWFIKPDKSRAGDAQISEFLRTDLSKRQTAEVSTRAIIQKTAAVDESDMVLINRWLRRNNVELGTEKIQDGIIIENLPWQDTEILVRAKLRIP
jgi:hypothetical protein